jgi:hypothetical protein
MIRQGKRRGERCAPAKDVLGRRNAGATQQVLRPKGVSTLGVGSVPMAVRDYIELHGEEHLPPELEELAELAVSGAMAELRRRRLLVMGQADDVARGKAVLNGD